ncbi:MAG: hypothetical protein HRU19_32615 [Pseudobacteriovorax sp.]|nr:hypothetical protein [Pseudobacteriovorax sp.]
MTAKKKKNQYSEIKKPQTGGEAHQTTLVKTAQFLYKIFKSAPTVGQWMSILTPIALCVAYVINLNVENSKLTTDYQKSIAKAKLNFEAQLRAVQAQHIKQLREEDRDHDKELREIYSLLGTAQNKIERVKIERDLFAFALGIDKENSRNYDPLEKLNKLRSKNVERIKKSIEEHRKTRETKRKENEKLKELLKEIESKDMELDREFDEKIPTVK